MLTFICLIFSTLSLCIQSTNKDAEFISGFYDDYVFRNKHIVHEWDKVCSEKMLKFLSEKYNYDCETGNCYATWYFRSEYQDGPEDKQEVEEIKQISNDLYEVYYNDMGHKGVIILKLKTIGAQRVIDEIISNKIYNH